MPLQLYIRIVKVSISRKWHRTLDVKLQKQKLRGFQSPYGLEHARQEALSSARYAQITASVVSGKTIHRK